MLLKGPSGCGVGSGQRRQWGDRRRLCRESRAGWSLSAGWGDDGGSGEQWGSGEQAHNVLGTLREVGAVGGARAHGSQTSGLSDEVGGNIIY